MPGWRFIRHFVYMSLGSSGLIVAALGWVTMSYLTHSMLEREKTLTIDYIERIVRRCISPAELRTAHQLRAESTALQRVAEELSLVKKIIDAHGGHLTLEAHVPHGTKATVWLPGRYHPTEETIL